MDVQNITFGVEIECYVPVGTLTAGGYHHGLPIPGFPEGWNAQNDGSLYTRSRSKVGVEIVSPVLKGVDGIRQVKTVLEKLRQLGATVNTSCGFHVHVGFGSDPTNLQKLVNLVANFERALFAATGTKARERGTYCRPIREAFRSVRFDSNRASLGAAVGRYHLLNLTNILGGNKPTVEFRAFAGTLNFDKIVSYIRLCVGIVERALKMSRPTKWDAARPVDSSPIHRSGEGQTDLTRLFYQLGWIKGRQPHTHGDLSGEGLPTISRSKRVLIRLARQYDTRE